MSTDHNDHAHDSHGDVLEPVHPHIAPWQLYAKIFGALICLTVVTVVIANVDLGHANLAIAVLVATVKASLVVTFFMHLKDDRRFNALLFLGSLLFGGIFLAYTLNDTAYRGQVDGINGMRRDYRTGEWAPGTAEGKKEGFLRAPEGAEHGEGADHGAAPAEHAEGAEPAAAEHAEGAVPTEGAAPAEGQGAADEAAPAPAEGAKPAGEAAPAEHAGH